MANNSQCFLYYTKRLKYFSSSKQKLSYREIFFLESCKDKLQQRMIITQTTTKDDNYLRLKGPKNKIICNEFNLIFNFFRYLKASPCGRKTCKVFKLTKVKQDTFNFLDISKPCPPQGSKVIILWSLEV